MLLPVSLLASYLYCSRKVFLQRALSLREPERPERLIGTIRHAILEGFRDREESVITSISRTHTREEIGSLIRETYDVIARERISSYREELYRFALDHEEVFEASRPALDADARLRADLIATFIEAHGVEHEELYVQLTPRIVAEQRFESPELGIVGVIDRILLYPDEAVPFEFKTGRSPRAGMWPGHRIQLGAYLLLASSSWAVRRGVVRYLDSGEDVELKLNPFVEHELRSLVSEVRSVLEGSSLPRKVEQKSKCAACGLRDACYSERSVTDAMIARFGKDAVIR